MRERTKKLFRLSGVAVIAAALGYTLYRIERPDPAFLVGTAMVVDGDTLRMADGQRVRLWGIDAPEYDQLCRTKEDHFYPCGIASAVHLKTFLDLGRGLVLCETRGRDSYNRMLGICRAGERELNREMVRTGWAVAYLRYTDAYAVDQEAARGAEAGLWRGSFVQPEMWRHRFK